MTSPTCPECGAALPSCPWTGPRIVCLECRTPLGRRRPGVRLLLLAAALAAVLAVAAGF